MGTNGGRARGRISVHTRRGFAPKRVMPVLRTRAVTTTAAQRSSLRSVARSTRSIALRRFHVTGRYYLGGCYYGRGDFRAAIEHYQWIIGKLSGERETQRFDMSGLPFSGACALAALCFVELGEPAGAEELLRRGKAAASAANHLYSKVPLAISRQRRCHDVRGKDPASSMAPLSVTLA